MVEPPAGSPLRSLEPRTAEPDGTRRSLLWTFLAANKRTVGSLGAEDLDDLVSRADVLIVDETAAPGLEMSVREILERHPRLVVVLVSPCGLEGPYPAFHGSDIVVQALSGYMTVNGSAGRAPLRAPGRIAPYAVGANAFVGALAALWKRERTGCGDLVEVSEMETLAAITPLLRIQYLGGDRTRQGGPEAGVRMFPCRDGHVSFHAYAPGDKERVLEAFGLTPDALPPDLLTGPQREVTQKALRFFSAITRERTMREVFDALERHGVVCGMLASPHDLLAHEQLLARGFYSPLETGDGQGFAFPGPGSQLGEGVPVPPRPAPSQDDVVPVEALGWPRRAPADPPRDDSPPLEGVRVADFTQAWIGPFATMLLADLGADVIKIESHKRPDIWRPASPEPPPGVTLGGHRFNRSCNFNSVNRNKLDLTLDLRAPEALALCRRLITEADIVADNYTPRVMERFGLGHDALKDINPHVIAVSGSGFGRTGPWADFKSNGSAIEALGGWDFAHRYPGGEPQLMAFYQPDAICGFHMAAMMLVSLLQRQRTGRGDTVDLSMLELAGLHIGEALLEAQVTQAGEPPSANRDRDASPNGVFPCAGEDRWIAITAPDDAAWRAIREMPAFPQALRAAEFDTLEGRQRNEDQLERLLGEWTAGWAAVSLMQALQARGVPAGVVVRWIEVFEDPHLTSRSWFVRSTHPDTGAHLYNGFAWRFARSRLEVRGPPPRLGEHSEQVLRERLCLDEAAIADLRSRDLTGVVV